MGWEGGGVMDQKAEQGGTDPLTELTAADRRLSDAYEAARAADYQPGSREMRELAAAEDHYQRAHCPPHHEGR